jgi:hypothetical protein
LLFFHIHSTYSKLQVVLWWSAFKPLLPDPAGGLSSSPKAKDHLDHLDHLDHYPLAHCYLYKYRKER